MPLLDGTIDDLILKERKNIQKYLAGQIELKIVIDKWDEYLLRNVEEENTWLERQLSKKILA